jgi:hypothetical protein
MQVKIKKSVLQSLLKRSLSESSERALHDSDPSRHLSMDDNMMDLPTELPLRASDRMATQLDTELPPVDDPDYLPANRRELALALHAMAEMVPDEMVEKAYRAIGHVIEQLSSESSDDPIVQFESLYRKNLLLQRILGEAVEDEEDGEDVEFDDSDMALSVHEVRRHVEDAIEKMKLDDEIDKQKLFQLLNVVTGLVMKKNISMEDVDHLVRLTNSVPGLVDLAKLKFDKVLISASGNLGALEKKLTALIIDELPTDADRIARRAQRDAPVQKPSLRGTAQKMGYAAESGLRQALVGNIQPLWALKRVLFEKNPDSMKYFTRSVYAAFKDAVTLPENRAFNLELLDIDEQELDEYIDLVNTNEFAIKKSEFYKNFSSLIMLESLSRIAELNFRSSGRPIAKAYMKEFGEQEISAEENKELAKMAELNLIDDEVDEILDAAGEQDFRGLFTAAVMMTAQDVDAHSPAIGKYLEPAFTTFKKQGPGTKPPELIVRDYKEKFAKFAQETTGEDLDPEEYEFIDKVKAAGLAAKRASREAQSSAKNSKKLPRS